jgi:hypothetical protein
MHATRLHGITARQAEPRATPDACMGTLMRRAWRPETIDRVVNAPVLLPIYEEKPDL